MSSCEQVICLHANLAPSKNVWCIVLTADNMSHGALTATDSTNWKRSMLLSLASAMRIAPWLCILAIAILSLVPGEARPHTGLPGQAEHFLAYFLTAVFLGVQKRNLAHLGTLAIALCAYAGILETLQLWVPGRSAQLIDFAASSSGALSGIILQAVFYRFRQRTPQSRGLS